MSLAKNIKRYRCNAGICQEFMAIHLSVGQSTYSRLEKNDKACARRLDSIARLLDTTPETLRNYHNLCPPDEAEELTAARNLIAQQQQEIDQLKATNRYWEQVWQRICGGGVKERHIKKISDYLSTKGQLSTGLLCLNS